MVIVAGHITVEPQQREAYLAGCVSVVEQARGTPGCLDFAITADLVDPGRVNIFERWESQAAVESFRGNGPGDEQGAAMLSASVAEYDIAIASHARGRWFETSRAHRSRMDTCSQLSQLLDSRLRLARRRIQQFAGAFRLSRPLLLDQLQVDDHVDELLLGSIVQIAGDLATSGICRLQRSPLCCLRFGRPGLGDVTLARCALGLALSLNVGEGHHGATALRGLNRRRPVGDRKHGAVATNEPVLIAMDGLPGLATVAGDGRTAIERNHTMNRLKRSHMRTEGADAVVDQLVVGPCKEVMTGTRFLLAFAAVGALATLVVAPAESAHAKRIVGTKGPDRIVGTAKADQVKSRRGDDRIKGRGGKDRLSGGPGADRLNALDGRRDRAVKGGPGNDFCRIDRADLARMKSCETAKIGRGGGPGAGQNCVTAEEPRLPADAQAGDPRRMARGDVPPVFSDAFFAITITLNASADGLDGNALPISIEEVCDVPTPMRTEAAQLAGGEGIAIISPATRVFDIGGQQLNGAAAMTALAGADSVTLRAQLKRPAQWGQDEDGQPVPTFVISRADITD